MGNTSKNRKKNSRRKKTKRENTKNDIRSIEISGGNPAIIPALFSLADIGLIIFEMVKGNESLSSPERSPSSRVSQSDTISTPSERRPSTTSMLPKPKREQSRTAIQANTKGKTGTSEHERQYRGVVETYVGQTTSEVEAKAENVSSFLGRKKKQFTESLTTMDKPTFNTIFNFEIKDNLSEKTFYHQSYNKNNFSDIGVFDKLFIDIKSVFYEEYQKLESSFFDIKYKLLDMEQGPEQQFKILNTGYDELREFIINPTKTQEVNITVNLKPDSVNKEIIFINNKEQEKIKIFKEDKNTTIKDLLLVTRIYNLLKKNSKGYYLIYFNNDPDTISYIKKEDFNKNISEHFTYLFGRSSGSQIDEIFIVPTRRNSRKFYLDFSEYFKLPNNPFKGKSFGNMGIKDGLLELTGDITKFNIKGFLPTSKLRLSINLTPSTPKPKQNSSPGFLSRLGRKQIGPVDNVSVSGSENSPRALPKPKKTPKKDKHEQKPKKMSKPNSKRQPKPGTGIKLESAPSNVEIES